MRAGPEVVDHAGQARGEDVHALSGPQLICRRWPAGAPAGEGFWRPWPWPFAQPWPWAWASWARFLLLSVPSFVLAELFFLRCSAAGSGSRSRPRCERPLGWSWRLGRDVAGVAQRPEIPVSKFLVQVRVSALGHEVGIGAWNRGVILRGLVTRQPAVVQVPCPSSPRTWTSGSVRGKHVIKFVQVPCPSSCPSSGFRWGKAHGIACLESGRNTERACNTAARSCPSSLSKFPGRTWTSGSVRGKHVIKFVQVPCPSSCPSSGFRPEVGIGACLESGPAGNRGLPGIGALLLGALYHSF